MLQYNDNELFLENNEQSFALPNCRLKNQTLRDGLGELENKYRYPPSLRHRKRSLDSFGGASHQREIRW